MVDEYTAPPPLKMRPQKENFSTDLEYFLQADLSREEFFNICKKRQLDVSTASYDYDSSSSKLEEKHRSSRIESLNDLDEIKLPAEFVSTTEKLAGGMSNLGYDFNKKHSVTAIYSDCYNSSDDDSEDDDEDDDDDSKNEDEMLFCAPAKITAQAYAESTNPCPRSCCQSLSKSLNSDEVIKNASYQQAIMAIKVQAQLINNIAPA